MEQSELNQILEQHKLWIETKGVQGKRANLTGANLMGAFLSGANLTGADLEGAGLTDANLKDANLFAVSLRFADLTGADLEGADLTDANLTGAYLAGASLKDAKLRGANLSGANLRYAKLSDAILPDISWIIPGCLVQLNNIRYGFYLKKENKFENFVQDSFGFIIQNNPEESTFDMLLGGRIIRNIPDWVKLSGLKKAI